MQSAGTGSALLDIPLEYTTMTQTSRQKQRRSAMEENAVRADTANPLGILSAERYNDGSTLSIARSLTEMAQQQQQQQHSRDMSAGYIFGFEELRAVPRSPTGAGAREVEGRRNEVDGARVKSGKGGNRKKEEEEGSTERKRKKKKQKLSEDEEADDEATKKARGRPRLDTKDETAADVCHCSPISYSLQISHFAPICRLYFSSLHIHSKSMILILTRHIAPSDTNSDGTTSLSSPKRDHHFISRKTGRKTPEHN